MALIKCKECGGEVSTQAETCPKCGVQVGEKPIAKEPMGCGTIIVLIFFGGMIISTFKSSFFPDNRNHATSTSSACSTPMVSGQTIEVGTQPNRIVQLTDQTIVDNKYQSTLRQTFFIKDAEGVNDADVRNALKSVYERAKNTCRENLLQSTLIFLHLSSDTVKGMNWVGRLDASSTSSPKIDVEKSLIASSNQAGILSHSRCDRPAASNTGKKEIRWSDEVDLPPVEDRKILGIWLYQHNCNLSFESVKGSVYRVIRCSDCSGGKTGEKITQVSSSVFQRIPQRKGEYFQVLPNGNLRSFDDEGEIETYLKQTNGLWPDLK